MAGKRTRRTPYLQQKVKKLLENPLSEIKSRALKEEHPESRLSSTVSDYREPRLCRASSQIQGFGNKQSMILGGTPHAGGEKGKWGSWQRRSVSTGS